LVQIFSLELCSQTPSVHVLPLMWETKFHTHAKQLAELCFCIFLYILTFTFLDSTWEEKRLNRIVAVLPELSLLLFFLCMQFWSVSVVPKYLNFAIPSKGLFAIFMLYLCPAFLQCDINIYLVFPGFTSRPTPLLASNTASVIF
jgi:hypothetical protein